MCDLGQNDIEDTCKSITNGLESIRSSINMRDLMCQVIVKDAQKTFL